MDEIPMKKNDIPAIRGKPTFTLCQPLMADMDKNLIHMKHEGNPIYRKGFESHHMQKVKVPVKAF